MTPNCAACYVSTSLTSTKDHPTFHLAFHKAWPDTPVVDLLAADDADLPTDGGAYVLGTAGETMLVYPWATSPIFYIGSSKNLRRRLAEHRDYTKGAQGNYWDWYWPRYQYGAAFGASCVWFTSADVSPKDLEAALVSEFYLRFGSIPVANTHWPKTPSRKQRLSRS